MSVVDTLHVRPYEDADRDAVVALWQACGLTIPANDPDADIAFCRGTPSAALLVGTTLGRLVATVMTGHEGHRGWLYYVGVDPAHRGRGFGARMVAEAEAWLAARGVPKVNLLIRETNTAVTAFYERLGYNVEPRVVMAKRLRP